MAVSLTTTSTAAIQYFIMIYGPAKIGKTYLAATAPGCLIINADQGCSTLRGFSIPKVDVTSYAHFLETVQWLKTPAAKDFKWVMIDDLTELCDMYLTVEKPKHKNTMQAYGALNDEIMRLVRDLRSINTRPIVMNCKQERIKDELTGTMIYSPMIPGKAIQPMLPYLFGEVYHLEDYKNPADNTLHKVLRTKRDPFNQFEAGSRTGRLAELEAANMNYIFAKAFQP